MADDRPPAPANTPPPPSERRQRLVCPKAMRPLFVAAIATSAALVVAYAALALLASRAAPAAPGAAEPTLLATIAGLGFILVGLSLALAVLGAAMAHRTLGAAQRLDEHLRARIDGAQVGPVKLRPKDPDALHAVADAINILCERRALAAGSGESASDGPGAGDRTQPREAPTS